MTDSSSARTNIVAFLAVLALSAISMVWLFWRFPWTTAIITVSVLAALGISARLARSIEVGEISDLDQGKQRV